MKNSRHHGLSRTLAVALIVAAATPVAAIAQETALLIWSGSLHGSETDILLWPVAVAAAEPEEIAVADAYEPRVLVFKRVGASWGIDRVVRLATPPVDMIHDGTRYVLSLRESSDLVGLEGPELENRRIPLEQGAIPGALAALPNERIAVYDHAGQRILRIDRTGSLVDETPIDGYVSALAVGPGAGLLVALPDRGVVLKLSASGEARATWKLPSNGSIPPWPVGIATDPGGDIAVIDRHGSRIIVLDPLGNIEGFGSRRGWEPGLLLYPTAIARLAEGKLVVADQGNGRLQIFERAASSPSRP